MGEGSNFLTSPADPITLYKTHSLRWLAQIVCQIIKTVRWEGQFKCEGIATLVDFSAVVKDLEALEPVSIVVQSGGRARDGSVPHRLQPAIVAQFASKTGLPPGSFGLYRRCTSGGMGYAIKRTST